MNRFLRAIIPGFLRRQKREGGFIEYQFNHELLVPMETPFKNMLPRQSAWQPLERQDWKSIEDMFKEK